MTILRHLTHNADIRFRLHDLQDAPGFTLVEGLRLRDDINQVMLPVTCICINAGLRLFTFYAGESRLRFTVQGPGSGLRVREAWREDGKSGWHRRDTGTPHAIEQADHQFQKADMPDMLARLHPGLPDALADRRFSTSWEFRTGLTGSNVARIATTAEAPA